jgi:hypothetical protein
MKLENKVYDVLKFFAQIFLPALATLYFALAQIWGLPYGEQIVGTITAIDAFIGALLGISTAQYNKDQEAKKKKQEAKENEQ